MKFHNLVHPTHDPCDATLGNGLQHEEEVHYKKWAERLEITQCSSEIYRGHTSSEKLFEKYHNAASFCKFSKSIFIY